ncbi:DNA topoisomerase II [Pseudomonas phage vB_PpuM-Pori-4]
MAKVISKTKLAKAKSGIAADLNIREVPLLEWSIDAYIGTYATMTLADRAIPDMYDGLMPSERRAIWAAHVVGATPDKKFMKSARVVGDMIGKFHPHGDTSAYGTVVKSVKHVSNPYFLGQGNWGTFEDPKGFAAMRYTETKLSKYAMQVLLDSDYLAVTEMIPNYDGSLEEPFILPALLPNLLLNGSYGVATGATTYCPSFEAEGVITLIQKLLKGRKLKARDCMASLVFDNPYGGYAVIDEDDEESTEELVALFEGGQGRVYYSCDYELLEDEHAAYIRGFVPYQSILKGVEKIAEDERVASIIDDSDIDDNGKGFIAYKIIFKRSVSKMMLQEVADDVLSVFDKMQNFKMNVNERAWNEYEGKADCKFGMMGVIGILEKWVAWRLALEQRYLEYKTAKLEQRNWSLNTLLLACNALDIIVAALKRDDTEAYLAKTMKITPEQAEYILDRQVRSLKKLNQDKMKAELKANLDTIKQHKEWIKTPEVPVAAQLKDFAKLLAE